MEELLLENNLFKLDTLLIAQGTEWLSPAFTPSILPAAKKLPTHSEGETIFAVGPQPYHPHQQQSTPIPSCHLIYNLYLVFISA